MKANRDSTKKVMDFEKKFGLIMLGLGSVLLVIILCLNLTT
jgi:hypothetical protein